MYEIPWVHDFFEVWPQQIPPHAAGTPFYRVLKTVDSETLLPDRELLAAQEAQGGEQQAMLDLWHAWVMFVDGNQKEGLKRMRRIARGQFYRPEPYIFIGIAGLLEGHRGVGYKALHKALSTDPKYEVLNEILGRFGIRQRPVLPFFSRDNVLNIWLGRLRSRLKTSSR